ncbi:MAG: hypothetical protein IPM86_10595 [Saprospiraceae bacterium]|nr:hypothetical protein [Saprospiraceae bacterium]
MMVREIEVHTESMAEQKLGGYSSRYRFTGKELDPLSGLYDFGARYYDPRLSVWVWCRSTGREVSSVESILIHTQ